MTKKSKATTNQSKTDNLVTFAFTKQNYRLLIIGIVVMTLGFILMIGGGSEDPAVFSDKIFNFRRMTLAPILIIAGYIIEIFAIMRKPKQ